MHKKALMRQMLHAYDAYKKIWQCAANASTASPVGKKKLIQPMARFELATPCLQGRCNNHYATSAYLINMLRHAGIDTANENSAQHPQKSSPHMYIVY